jgi:hypothetical protein
MARILIGLDVAKDSLEAFVRPTGQRRSFPNTADGIAELVAWAAPHAPPSGSSANPPGPTRSPPSPPCSPRAFPPSP